MTLAMKSSASSRQRVIDHGEVLTPPGLVRDMLDLPGVADECLRIEARFLEPACGDGNFLTEIIRRRLDGITKKYPKHALIPWERDALRGLANIYGIELLADNVQACRNRLSNQFANAYTTRFGTKARPAVIDAARHIAATNIHFGDSLAMTTPGEAAHPLVFTQWSMLPGGKFKRRRFEYRELIAPRNEAAEGLFARNDQPRVSDAGQPVFLAEPVDDLPLIHYIQLGHEPHPGSLPR
jgi:hypothetical protein